jgi:hypothetical protein
MKAARSCIGLRRLFLMPVKNGHPYGRIKQVVLPDGKTFITTKEGVTPKEVGDSSGSSKSGDYPKQ